MTKNKKEEFNPWPSYFLVIAGICLLISRFLGNIDVWSKLDILKVVVGVVMIGYSIYQLISKK